MVTSTDSPGFFLLYLHGFNSSPGSHKARQLREYWHNQQWPENLLQIPALPFSPATAADTLLTLLKAHRARLPDDHRMAVMGSSLGGYYSTWLAELHDLKAVVINPAVRPYELLKDHLGPQYNYHTEERCVLGPEHLEELKQLEVRKISKPQNFLLLAQTGDETLDYRQAVEKYQDSASIIQSGGSHAFDEFELMLPRIFEFFRSG